MPKLITEEPGKMVPDGHVVEGTLMGMIDPTREPAEGSLKLLSHDVPPA